eukprot:858315-Rhodomonas_salina.1
MSGADIGHVTAVIGYAISGTGHDISYSAQCQRRDLPPRPNINGGRPYGESAICLRTRDGMSGTAVGKVRYGHTNMLKLLDQSEEVLEAYPTQASCYGPVRLLRDVRYSQGDVRHTHTV